MRSETQYFLRRAREEAYRAIRSEQAEEADAHQALSVRYSTKAVMLLVEDDQEALACNEAAKRVLSD